MLLYYCYKWWLNKLVKVKTIRDHRKTIDLMLLMLNSSFC